MFKNMLKRIKGFHKDEAGAEGLEKLLLIGAIILPLLGILIFFKQEIFTWVEGIWGEVRDDNDSYKNLPTGGN
ncbi:MAG: hypothetical protein WD768_00510 [Phycisphaeraceae bacterium]